MQNFSTVGAPIENIPFFSIILPVYNREKFIANTIQSVLNQTFRSWELIVVDDGSTDNSTHIIDSFCKIHPQIKLIKQVNSKQPAARNTGIKVAKGAWIAFIDSDDLWLPIKLERQYDCIIKNPEVDVVFSDGYTKFHDSKIRHYYHHDIVHGFFTGYDLYRKMLFGNLIPILSLLIKSSWVERVGSQDETVPGVEDHDYCLRLCRAGANFYGMEDRLFEYHVHDSNFSSNLVNQHYISSGIRIKNFELQLLTPEDIKRFRRLFKWYLSYFKQHGKTDWVYETREKVKKLNIPSPSVKEYLSERFSELVYHALVNAKKDTKTLLHFLVKTFYFHPKKTLSGHKNRIFSRYTRWSNSQNISASSYLQLSANANITFLTKNGGFLDVKGLHLGEFSRISFNTENASMIGGADIVINNFCNFDITGQVIIGNHVLFNNGSMISCREEIIIGDDTSFGEGVKIYDYNYKDNDKNVPFMRQGYATGKIQIGNNVQVQSNTIIMPGVQIGDGCVIGANNVISISLSPGTIVKSKPMEIIGTS